MCSQIGTEYLLVSRFLLFFVFKFNKLKSRKFQIFNLKKNGKSGATVIGD